MARKALILGRLLGFAGEPGDVAVESLVPEEARGLTRDEYLATLERWDADWEKRAAAARAKHAVLRYVVSVTRSKIKVGMQAVDRSHPLRLAQRHRQPDRLHHRPLPAAAGDHRRRRRAGGDRRRGAE